MKKIINKFKYKSWLFFGGRRTEDGFKFLSDSILSNRKLIQEIRNKQRNLETRVWELEKHTPQETMQKITDDLKELEETMETAKWKK